MEMLKNTYPMCNILKRSSSLQFGYCEYLGWRSTRIRLDIGHHTLVLNEEMARLDIENIARRPYIRRKANKRVVSRDGRILIV
jgi:hypothetical protein